MKNFIKYSCCLLIISLFLTVIACSPQNSGFSRDGINVQFPENWKVGMVDSSDADIFMMRIEKEGHGASAIAVVEWQKGKFHLDTVMNIAQQAYLQEKVYQNGNISFSQVKEEIFAGNTALTASFGFTALDVKYSGKVHCFYLPGCDKTLRIVYQEVADDAEKQKADFEFIENNFTYTKK